MITKVVEDIRSKRIPMTVGSLVTIIAAIAAALGVRYATINRMEKLADAQVSMNKLLEDTLTPLVMKHEKQLTVLNTMHGIKE